MPALRVGGIEVVCVSVRHGGTAATETQQLAVLALRKQFMPAEFVHFRPVENLIHRLFHSTDVTFKTAAGHQTTFGGNGEVTVSAVTAVIYCILIQTFRYLKKAFLVKIQRPKVVLEVESGVVVNILLELFPASIQQVTILQRLDVPAGVALHAVLAGRTVAPECKDVNMVLHHKVDDVRQFVHVGT